MLDYSEIMVNKIDNLSLSTRREFDEILDVRSPAEFAEDHIPGAINLPVLTDKEREEVGTIYCQQSRHEARRLGATYITKNVSNYLAKHFAKKSNEYRPLVYCWRGGMRSQSMATILNNVGWFTKVIAGGYRTWRQNVVACMRESELQHDIVLIDGQTGANKTKILAKLKALGHQTLDLEDLAKHRGSVFGGFENIKQPPQKYFESLIYDELCRFDFDEPVFVEAESPKIGRRGLPSALVNKMRHAPRIEVRAAAQIRAMNLTDCYSDLISTPYKIYEAIEYLRPYHAANLIRRWQQLADKHCYDVLALALIESHYDPCYERQRRKHQKQTSNVIELAALDEASLENAAKEIARVFSHLRPEQRLSPENMAEKALA